jgi:uncharacterized protein (DUF1778 family)
MNELRYTLLTDGSSDRALMPIIDWLLRTHSHHLAIQATWADLRALRQPPDTLAARVTESVKLYPCDVLFIHRDAESQSYDQRWAEVQAAIAEAGQTPPALYVIPVRMMEAWLLIDEAAIRRASGNPNGKVRLIIPPVSRLEQLTDPKQTLYDLLRSASELKGRRLDQMNLAVSRQRITQIIEDYSPLRTLSAFQRFEADVRQFMSSLDQPSL